jgi:hypothetical protein
LKEEEAQIFHSSSTHKNTYLGLGRWIGLWRLILLPTKVGLRKTVSNRIRLLFLRNLEVQESLKRGKQHCLVWQHQPKCNVGHNVLRNWRKRPLVRRTKKIPHYHTWLKNKQMPKLTRHADHNKEVTF